MGPNLQAIRERVENSKGRTWSGAGSDARSLLAEVDRLRAKLRDTYLLHGYDDDHPCEACVFEACVFEAERES